MHTDTHEKQKIKSISVSPPKGPSNRDKMENGKAILTSSTGPGTRQAMELSAVGTAGAAD